MEVWTLFANCAVYISMMVTVNKELYSTSPTEWLYVLVQVCARKGHESSNQRVTISQKPLICIIYISHV